VIHMKYDATELPDNPESLKRIIADLTAENEQISVENKNLSEKIEHLKEQYQLLQKRFFGRSSEKLTKEDEAQGILFNEAEEGIETPPDSSNEHDSVITVETHTRRKAGRKPLSDDLPREEIIYDLTEEEKKCPCCNKERPPIGQEETEELDIIPAKIYVIKRIYKKYGACGCDEFLNAEIPEVKSAPFEKRMIPGSIASSGLLAFVFTSKFCDALPFYRQSKMFERIDADISRATMCNWVIAAYEKMHLFFEIFEAHLKSGAFIRMDETIIQVLHEEGRSPQAKSYMWVAIGYPIRGRPLVLFRYYPTRSGEIPDQFLSGFSGYLQTDGYDGYNRAVRNNDIVHVGCMAHARREFNNAYDSGKKNKDSRAFKALAYIQKIYKIESDLRSENLSDEIFIERRRKLAAPVLDELHAWLLRNKAEVLPQSLVGKAISYTLNEWDKLIRYLDLACMTPDNNEIERAIRPFVVGRKNWLFSNTPRGARASAAIYSLIESAKANRLEPYAYLRFLFSRLPHALDRESVIKLLPCFLDAYKISD